MDKPDESHYERVASSMLLGLVTPFLGAGVNLCERPENGKWRPKEEFPSGGELARYLAKERGLGYPPHEPKDLLRVSQYFDAVLGELRLYMKLHDLFIATHPPTKLHLLLAEVAGRLHKSHKPQQLLVTTNYDDALERAFDANGVEYDLVWYEAKREARGKFYHRPPGLPPVLIDVPNEYADFDLDHRPVILKLHGAIDRAGVTGDSYVITEDHYIDYLTDAAIPKLLTERMATSHLLFLGYSLRDWNLRVVLNRIWREQQLSLPSWSIQKWVDSVEAKAWRDRGGDIEIFDVSLSEYEVALRDALGLAPVGAKA